MFFEDYAVGDAATSQTRTITEADIVAFAGISGDFNEIHVSETVSAAGAFGKRIAHGMLGLSVATGLAVQMGFMRDTVVAFRGLEWEFVAPVLIGDTIHADVTVTELKAMTRLGIGKVSFKVDVRNQKDEVVQRGAWHLLVKQRPKPAG
jgi:3-hydroxybutyryl-CoA dehydratase